MSSKIAQEYITVKEENDFFVWIHVYPHKLDGVSKMRFFTLPDVVQAAMNVAESYSVPFLLPTEYRHDAVSRRESRQILEELSGPDYGTPDYDDCGYSESTQPYLW